MPSRDPRVGHARRLSLGHPAQGSNAGLGGCARGCAPGLRPFQLLELAILAALWGGSFLFMRVATPEFGPMGVAELRVLIGAAALTLLFTFGGNLKDYRSGVLPL